MRKILASTLLLILLMCSCRKLFFDGETLTRLITLQDFHAADFSGIFNIKLVQDSVCSLEITGEKNPGSIIACVENDTLIIKDPHIKSFNPNKNTLILHFKDLKYLVTRNPVTLTTQDTIRTATLSYDAIGEIAEVRMMIDCNTFILVNSANTLGFFHLAGKAENTNYFNRYGCSIIADSLQVKNAVVRNESIGEVRINASEMITAYIVGPGNIFYYGNPVIHIAEKTGEGRIIKIP